MTRLHRGGWVAGLATVLLVSGMSAASAITWPPNASPPSPQEFTAVSNAMLQPADVPAAVTAKAPWTVGYDIPAGGQDPMALCIDKRGHRVILPTANTIGYQSQSSITQSLYYYPSVEAAAAAWRVVDAQVTKSCSGTYDDHPGTVTITRGVIPSPVGGPAGWWIRTKGTGGAPGDTYLTALLVGSAIQLVYADQSGKPLSTAQVQSVQTVTPVLASRYANAATAPVTQPVLLTTAQQQMLQPADVPATLPYRTPAQGGWSSFGSSMPASFGWACGLDEKSVAANFGVDFGGQGDIFDLKGDVGQLISVYPDVATATTAWRKLKKSVLACRSGAKAISATDEVSTFQAGSSPLAFGGTQGLWWRIRDTYPSPGKQCTTSEGKKVACGEYSTGAYGIYLLVGRSIQQVAYTRTIVGLRNVPLDQVAVNQLAEQLATRWFANVA